MGFATLTWLILSQQNMTDIVNQEKRCNKLVTTLVYFPKWLSFKIYENLYRIHSSFICFESRRPNLTKSLILNLLQSSWFQIQ